MPPLRICLIASEVAPFAKAGGLADVSAALARYLTRAGHDVRLFMPLYGRMGWMHFETVESAQGIELDFGPHRWWATIRTTQLPDSEVWVRCVDVPELFGGDWLYGDGSWEAFRFAALTRAALAGCQREGWAPHVVHVHDWHTALAPLYLKTYYGWDDLFADTRTLLTIHNLAYQGRFSSEIVGDLGFGLERSALHQEHLAEGWMGFLETGLLHATAITTVSETYAREIQTLEQGEGLDHLLRSRSDRLFGITNGVDGAVWDPATDPHLPANYSPSDTSGKRLCKRALLERFDLPGGDDTPVIGAISRLTYQKGFDLLPDALPVILHREDVRFILLGAGDQHYEGYFHWLGQAFPDKVRFYAGYDEELSHLIEAGSDIFLMPSLFEPCGLNQMYSLRYGTVPVVRRTGGLADTVEQIEADPERGTGVCFDEFSSRGVLGALEYALRLYGDRERWREIVRRGMSRDFSWEHQVERYVELYRRLPEL